MIRKMRLSIQHLYTSSVDELCLKMFCLHKICISVNFTERCMQAHVLFNLIL